MSLFSFSEVTGESSVSFPTPGSSRCLSLEEARFWSLPSVSVANKTSLDRIHVWERSVKSAEDEEENEQEGGGGCAESVWLGIMCKHVFLWVCACNHGFPFTACLMLSLAWRHSCHILSLLSAHIHQRLRDSFLFSPPSAHPAPLCRRFATRPPRRCTP